MRRAGRFALAVAGAAVVLGPLPSAAPGQTYQWQRADTTYQHYFQEPTNWSPNGVPGAGDNAVFDQNAFTAYAVAFADEVSNQTLTVRRDKLEFRLSNWTYALTSTTNASVVVGASSGMGAASADLLVGGGTLSSVTAIVGKDSDATGTITFDGSDAAWTNSGLLTVGQAGTGNLSIFTGASVSAGSALLGQTNTSSYAVQVSGSAQLAVTNDFIAGGYGSGTVSLDYGSSLLTGNAVLGLQSGSSGTVTLADSTTIWNMLESDLDIGRGGTGRLEITAGAEAYMANATLGRSGLAEGSALVELGNWVIGGDLNVGLAGQGDLEVSNGGIVSNDTLAVGGIIDLSGPTNGTGNVHVTGATLEAGNTLSIGRGGTGTVIVEFGGSVTAWSLYMGDGAGGSAFLGLSGLGVGADLTVYGDFVIGAGADATATFEAQGGAVVSSDYAMVVIGAAGLARGTATISDSGTQWTAASLQLGVADTADGKLTVTDGASLATDMVTIGGDGAGGGSGTLTICNSVEGAVSNWTNTGSVVVGNGGSGVLLIESGGQASIDGSVLAAIGATTATGSITVRGAGSLLDVAGSFDLGFEGDGTMLIETGAVVNSGSATLGTVAGAVGAASVLGAGSTWAIAGSLCLGGDVSGPGGAGTLTVADGGALNVGDGVTIHADGRLIVQNGSVSADSITLLGGTLEGYGTVAPSVINSTGQAVVPGGVLELAGPLTNLSGATLTKLGPGTLRIADVQQNGAGSAINIEEGVVQFDTNGGATGVRNLAVRVADGARAEFRSTQNIRELVLTGTGSASLGGLATRVIDTDGLEMELDSMLDLADKAMIFRSGLLDPNVDLERITGLIARARNVPAPRPLWSGTGITSSSAAADPQLRTLGVMLNRGADGQAIYTSFEDQPVDTASILMKYTYAGDANLDGVVDSKDYFRIDQGFLRWSLDPSSAPGYFDGDFDYSGDLTIDDYNTIDWAFLHQAGKPGKSIGGAAVPEPAGALAWLAAVALLARRRRSAFQCRLRNGG